MGFEFWIGIGDFGFGIGVGDWTLGWGSRSGLRIGIGD